MGWGWGLKVKGRRRAHGNIIQNICRMNIYIEAWTNETHRTSEFVNESNQTDKIKI